MCVYRCFLLLLWLCHPLSVTHSVFGTDIIIYLFLRLTAIIYKEQCVSKYYDDNNSIIKATQHHQYIIIEHNVEITKGEQTNCKKYTKRCVVRAGLVWFTLRFT